jgi:hypothetical protein
MRRKTTIASAATQRSSADWYLATPTDVMRFYCFDPGLGDTPITWTLIDRLDRTQLVAAGDKATAKAWAQRMGLKTWAYVRV